MTIKKALTRQQFERAAKKTTLQARGLEIARRVMVGGETQVSIAAEYGIKPPSVSRYVGTVWQAHVDGAGLPPGFEEVTAILTSDKVAIVRAWESEAQIKRLQQAFNK